MDKREMLYEISLKYNTLKMYENTLEQMKKNGLINDESYVRVEQEKEVVEKELVELLNPSLPSEDTGIKNPSIDKTKQSNAFVKALNKQSKIGEYKKLYDIRNNFFDGVTKSVKNDSPVICRDESKNELKKAEYKKPTFAEIQDKISSSQWISHSNFIIEFPKDEVNIDSWRVSGFYYHNSGCDNFCSSKKCVGINGELCVTVNDFADKNEDGTYNILIKTVLDLEKNANVHVIGNIYAKIVNNNGEELYRMCFEKCRFMSSNSDGFTYETNGLRKVNLNFAYDELHILVPNEKLTPKEFR